MPITIYTSNKTKIINAIRNGYITHACGHVEMDWDKAHKMVVKSVKDHVERSVYCKDCWMKECEKYQKEVEKKWKDQSQSVL